MKDINIVEVLGLVLAVLGIPQLWGSDWKTVIKSAKFFKSSLPWEKVVKDTELIAKDIINSGFIPTDIIGIGAGGAICASLMYRYFDKSIRVDDHNIVNQSDINLQVLDTVVKMLPDYFMQDGGIKTKIKSIEIRGNTIDVNQDSKILLVVAQTYTGETLSRGAEFLVAAGANKDNIKTISIYTYNDIILSKCASEYQIISTKKAIPLRKTMPWKTKDNSTDRYIK
ncbi:MAG TPA: hypothetical protein DCQ12_06590 [Candidatus Cloacimonas sp.]|jgi:hypoxanthine phosphoribosyltransferase|nr:hypothetical protein [Candidatus Cloacimonas sp.]